MVQIGLAGVLHTRQQASHPPRGLSALVRHATVQINANLILENHYIPVFLTRLFAKKSYMGL